MQMSKTFGKGDGSKPVLKDVSLSFYPGVKIGVLGGNGTAFFKTTLPCSPPRLAHDSLRDLSLSTARRR